MGGSPIGFLFFSHPTPHIYHNQHIDTFQQISSQLAVILEKGWLITELAEKQAEIEMRVSELKKLNDLKNTFLGMAAHDLRNPLGNIRMTGRVLSMKFKELTDEQRQRFLDEIEHQTDFMLKLLDDILDVTQMESGMFQLHPETIEIGTIMRSAVKRHSILSEYKKTRVLLTQIKDGLIHADPIRLRQVMDNLLSNAVKYSPPGSIIQVRVVQENDRWQIDVQDEGPGLSEHDQKKLFDSFVSLSSEPTAGEKSVGLGMAITHKIVKAHEGEIGMKNLAPKGAVFWVSFPANLPK
jgi:signal transduction histidine kinase